MTNPKGFIFLTTLLMISLISLLLLSALHQVLVYFKAFNGHEMQQQRFYQMERFAIRLAKQQQIPNACLSTENKANKIWEHLEAGQGCTKHFKQWQIQYLIEELGDFPCHIARVGKSQWASHHRRISLLLLEESHREHLLQIRYLTPVSTGPCLEKKTFIHLGLGSWRYVLK